MGSRQPRLAGLADPGKENLAGIAFQSLAPRDGRDDGDLVAGLELARHHGIDRIRVFSDSALVVNTVNGDWNLQPKHLKDLCVKAALLVKEFADIKLSWVPREMNLEADTLASRALGRGR